VYTLILYMYIATLTKGDYPALVNAGQYKTESACLRAGDKAAQRLGSGKGNLYYVCLANE
jgi:hypothetical protein